MHPFPLRFAACGLAAALALPACTPVTPEETSGPGPFSGAGAASAASSFNRASTANTAEARTSGSNTAAMSRGVTQVLAVHQASVRQRQLAEKRARAAQAALQKQIAAAEAAERPAPPAKKSAGSSASARPKVASRPRKKLPRYICVETVKEPATTVAKAEKAVMIWDTSAQELVGNNVYEIANPPAVGATTRFETYSAEYVGAGL